MRAVEKRLRERIKNLEAELEKVKDDRSRFRGFMSMNLRESIRIQGEKQTWNMAALIERLAKQMTQVERWWW